MSKPEEIARLLGEDETPKCDGCGGELLPDTGLCQTPGCVNFLLGFKPLSGVLKTKRGTTIKFDDFIDRSYYVAVFVPDRYKWHNKWSKKHRGAAVRRRIKMYSRRRELKAPLRLLYGGPVKYPQFYSVRSVWPAEESPPAGAPGAFGTYDITRTHKVLTIQKDNIVSLNVGGLKII